MRMTMRSVMQKLAVGLAKESKRYLSSAMTRPPIIWKDKQNSQILLSPPLVSLDVPEPEIWVANLNHSDRPSGPKISNAQIATIIDGKSMAEEIRSRVASEVTRMKEYTGQVPGLAVILVGDRRDSQTYVRNKIKACEEAGIKSVLAEFPNSCAEDDVIASLLKFNKDPSIHGVLVQLPLPELLPHEDNHSMRQDLRISLILQGCFDADMELVKGFSPESFLGHSGTSRGCCMTHDIILLYGAEPSMTHLDEEKILNLLSLEKDVDGFHPLNMGNLALRGKEPLFIPCTPKGCIELLIRSGVEIVGKMAVVIGRSNIVGLPISLLLQRHHATVTIVHACTKNPEQISREADIVVTAAGVPNLIRSSWLKPGAVVIDVGTFPIENPGTEYGYCLAGDVCFEEALRVSSAVTPVPGGVGPMTIAMLLCNTLDSAKRVHGFA